MLTDKLINAILDIGEQMLISGAEISRVEDSICRICKAYQAKRVDVFCITSNILLTVHLEDGSTLTQSRRVFRYSTNLNKLDKLNNLSRHLCNYTPELSYICEELEKINKDQPYGPYVQYMIYALIAGAFTIFFGGNLADALVSAGIAILLKLLINLVQVVDKNPLVINIFCSFVVGMLAIFAVNRGLGSNLEKIIIGNIMLMIPGVALTNSIRDMISGDTMSGLLRLCEAILLALSISVGFALATLFFGGKTV